MVMLDSCALSLSLLLVMVGPFLKSLIKYMEITGQAVLDLEPWLCT